MKKIALLTLALAATPITALAKNTVEDWKWLNTHYATYGEWTTACEDRADDKAIKRCYLRYVDAYASEPFGALFVFISAPKTDLRFSFEFERGTVFNENWHVTTNGTQIWSFDPDDCPLFGDCVLDDTKSATLAKALASPGAALEFKFTDPHGRSFDRSWSGDQPFADALNDLLKQTAERGLNQR